MKIEDVVDKYFPVLDHGFVALKDYMGSDLTIEESARVSYGKGTRASSDTRHLLRYLFRKGHTSPFEMCSLRFHIGIPITVMRQLIRQRTAKINEYSGRYSVMPNLFYRPDRERVTKQSKTNKQGSGPEQLTDCEYDGYRYGLDDVHGAAINHYETSLTTGIARETARNELPLSTYTFCYWKIDMRNMFNLLGKRLEPDAQPEYQDYAKILAGVAQLLCPLAFEAFQDYQQGGVTFTQAELAVLSSYFATMPHERELSDRTREHINSLLHMNGILSTKSGKESREQTEFWEKLKPKPKRDYTLDLSLAKSASFFEEKILEAS